jgi:exonuclease SbcC
MIFGECDVDLSSNGLTSIIGEHVSDRRRSNGSGKSAFLEAIRFALFDQTRGKSKQGVIRDGCSSCSVDLTFEHGSGRTFRVHRSRNASGVSKAQLWIDGKNAGDKVRIVNSVIASQLGVDADLFDLIYFFKQGDQFGFAEANPSDRKSILSKVFKMRHLEQCADRTREYKRECQDQSSKLWGMQHSTREMIDSQPSYEDLLNQSLDASADLANVQQLKIAKQQALQDLRCSADEARQYQSYFAALSGGSENKIIAMKIAIDDLDKLRSDKEEKLLKLAESASVSRDNYEKLSERAAKPTGDIEDLKVSRNGLSNDLKVFTAKLIAAKADKESCATKLRLMTGQAECPTCGHEIDNESFGRISSSIHDTVESLTDFIHDLERNVDLVESEIGSVTRSMKQHEQYAFGILASESAMGSMQLHEDRLHECKIDIDKIDADRKCLTDELERLSMSDVSNCASMAQAFGDNISSMAKRCIIEASDSLGEQISEMGIALNTADINLESCIRNESKLAEYVAATEVADRNLSVATTLSEAFGKDGIQALVIENALGSIEQFANEILQQMQTKFVVEMKTQKRTKTGNDKESLDIIIYDGVGVRPFESYSGGERTLINLALRLALSKAISSLHGVSMGSLFMDEVFGALDEVNREEVVKILSFLSRSFSQTFVVSHTDQVKDIIDSSVIIRRHNDWSDIRKTDGRGKETSSSSS